MESFWNKVAASALGGAACGLRALTGPAIATQNKVMLFLAVGELVADKLPNAPSRLKFAGLATRVASGAWTGWYLQRESGDRLLGAIIGIAAAVGAAHAGARFRQATSHDGVYPVGPALIEDASAFAIAAGAVRLSRSAPSHGLPSD